MIRYLVGRNRLRIGIQLQEARDKFGDIAEKHAEALQVNIYIYLLSLYLCFFVNSFKQE